LSQLLVHAERLDLVADDSGLPVVDLHPLGAMTRVLLEGAGGVQITVETAAGLNARARYRVMPQAHSLRAFLRE
jgi:iron(III) transport system ATP-binding protein